ncbi:MAG: GHKL domain-containing protein [Oscillospiraceae bacterium]|nr:GHKL domain-containing protein [Oscillospiraceae bacterium]
MNLPYQHLIDISTMISTFVVILLFLMVFEHRWEKRVYLRSLIPFLILWFGVNIAQIILFGVEGQGRMSLFTATIPSLLYFWIAAKDRRGRFFFTFCLVDTVMIWVMSITGIVDIFMGNSGFFTFVFRIIAFPIMLFVTYKWVRKPYLEMIHTVSKGWWLFAAMTGLFYLSLTIMLGMPTNLRLRPEDIPATLMVLALLPLVYLTIYRVLRQQQKIHEAEEHRRMLKMQTDMVELRAAEFRQTEETLRIERHDLRHRFQTIYTLLEKDCKQDAMDYITTAQKVLERTKTEHYCTHPVLDAILVAYFRKAKDKDIRVETELSIPEQLTVSTEELSTVFANALDNMIEAVEHLPREQRVICCKCVDTPRLIMEFSNPCPEEITFDEQGLPLSKGSAHGIGTRSIKAFADKHNGICTFTQENNNFILRLAI